MSDEPKIKVEASLVGAGVLDGSQVTVAVTLDDLFEALESQHLADEIHERLGSGDPVIIELRDAISVDFDDPDDDWGDRDEDEMFAPLDEWTRAELLRAIREDDGRRAIDVLKRAAA